jgi:hypothetical protein
MYAHVSCRVAPSTAASVVRSAATRMPSLASPVSTSAPTTTATSSSSSMVVLASCCSRASFTWRWVPSITFVTRQQTDSRHSDALSLLLESRLCLQ